MDMFSILPQWGPGWLDFTELHLLVITPFLGIHDGGWEPPVLSNLIQSKHNYFGMQWERVAYCLPEKDPLSPLLQGLRYSPALKSQMTLSHFMSWEVGGWSHSPVTISQCGEWFWKETFMEGTKVLCSHCLCRVIQPTSGVKTTLL